MENVLVVERRDEDPTIQIIDFGNASAHRYLPSSRVVGKEAYRAPEAFEPATEYDGFLSDAFAVGIVTFCTLFVAFPWQAAGGERSCPAFQHFRESGFSAFARRRRIPAGGCVADRISFAAAPLLAGLLEPRAELRQTLGEAVWREAGSDRQSVFEQEWFSDM